MIKFLLRLPDDLHAKLVDLAREENRSLHGHILFILGQAVKGRHNES